MVKGSCYGEDHLSYYGVVKEILQLEYPNDNFVMLLSCDWYDPQVGVKYDAKLGIVDVRENFFCKDLSHSF